MLRSRLNREQIRTALQLVGPMSEMIEKMHEIILAHHPAGVVADECPVCFAFQGEMESILKRWADVRAQAAEHWPDA